MTEFCIRTVDYRSDESFYVVKAYSINEAIDKIFDSFSHRERIEAIYEKVDS